jgi:hypothetical protein
MAATILSGTQTPTGNYTLYTNNTGQNVRLIIHFLFVHGGDDLYFTKRVNITGGSHGTVQFPASLVYQGSPASIKNIRLGIGKNIAYEDVVPVTTTTVQSTQIENGVVRTAITGTPTTFAPGPQVFPTEIVMRANQSMVFEASSSTSKQYISFNITVMPEGG